MVAEVNDQLGPIDMLVNNAGIFEYVTPETTTLDHWRRTIDVNLTGLYIVTWAVKDQMAERRFGRIVNMSSISGLAVTAVWNRLLRQQGGGDCLYQERLRGADTVQHSHECGRARIGGNRDYRRR